LIIRPSFAHERDGGVGRAVQDDDFLDRVYARPWLKLNSDPDFKKLTE